MDLSRTLPALAGAILGRRRRRASIIPALVLLAVAALVALSGCFGSSSSSAGKQTELRVFAASSLTDPFTELGQKYAAAHPDVKVTFNFAGSQDLAAQLQQGAPADVLATADTKNMATVADLVDTPQTFAANRLEIAVSPGNPSGISGLADLADPDLKVVLAAPEVPAGKYAAQVLENVGVAVKPVSLEDSVKGVVTKVSLGEADAGIVYVTDIIAAGNDVAGVTIPSSQNLTATYPIARVKASEHQQAAQDFVDLVVSAQGQSVLKAAGFLPPGTK